MSRPRILRVKRTQDVHALLFELAPDYTWAQVGRMVDEALVEGREVVFTLASGEPLRFNPGHVGNLIETLSVSMDP